MKKREEKIKALILDDVLSAFPTEIMRWWLVERSDAPRYFIFDPEEKFLIDVTDLSSEELVAVKLKMPKQISFRLKQNESILSEFTEYQDCKDFWKKDLDDIFHENQEEFEDALGVALDPFFKESVTR